MRAIFIAVTYLISQSLYANPITIEKSTSPDGKYYITIEPVPPGSGMAQGTAEVREKQTDKVVGTFDWEGFGESPDEHAFYVLWKPTDQAFAISYEATRGYTECDVYRFSAGKFQKITLPDYVKKALKREHVKEGSDKGYEEPKAWLSNSVLKVQVYNKAMDYDYWAFLKIPEHGSAVTAKLIKLQRKPPEP